MENSSDTSILRKILSKNPTASAFLMNPYGPLTESSNETLELLITTRFTGSKNFLIWRTESEDNLATSTFWTEQRKYWILKARVIVGEVLILQRENAVGNHGKNSVET